MAYAQFNGWDIVPMPASPAARQIDFQQHDSVGITQSPFNRKAQIQRWPGADWWEANMSLPPLTEPQLDDWVAWMGALRGMANVFQLGDPRKQTPRGIIQIGNPAVSITPLVNGAQLATATVLNLKNLKPSTARLLMPGDHLQVGYRLHIVAGVTSVASDANGNASVEIWPCLREDLADGASVITRNCKGLFRLAENTREWSRKVSRIGTVGFKVIEAL